MRLLALLLLTFCSINVYSQQTTFQKLKVGDSSPINSKAIFEAKSTTLGALIPRMTTTQRLAITSPPDGLLVYDTTLAALCHYDAIVSAWDVVAVGSGLLNPSISVITDSNGLLASSSTTSTEIGYVHGVTSSIQTQLNSKVTSVSGTSPLSSSGGTTPNITITQSGSTLSGYLSSSDWIAFNNKQAALTFGNLTDVGTDGLSITNGSGSVIGSGTTLSQQKSDNTHNGYLSSTDWVTFNNKVTSVLGSAPIVSSGGVNPSISLTTGNLTDAGTDGITITNGTSSVVSSGTTLSQQKSDASHNGYLSSGDWTIFNGKQSALSLPLSVANGGTNTANTLSNNRVIVSSGGTIGELNSVGSSGQVLTSNGAGTLPSWTSIGGTGTVTSVGLSDGSTSPIFTISNTPVTLSGTLTETLSTQSANNIFAGPASGSAAQPTFRTMVSGDYTVASLSPTSLINIGLSATVGSFNLVIRLKQNDGSTDPSSHDPVVIGFRNSTNTTGGYKLASVTSGLSIAVLSGSSLGISSGNPRDIYVYLQYNSGTPELCVSSAPYFDQGTPLTTTSVGSSSTSGTVLYCSTGRSGQPIRLIGKMSVNEATSTFWTSTPTVISVRPFPVPKAFFVSSTPCTTNSTAWTTNSYVTGSTSPTLTFTAPASGYYKIYTSAPLDNVPSVQVRMKISNTAGGAEVIAETEAVSDCNLASCEYIGSYPLFSVYYLAQGSQYSFDIQGKNIAASGTPILNCSRATTYIYGEQM